MTLILDPTGLDPSERPNHLAILQCFLEAGNIAQWTPYLALAEFKWKITPTDRDKSDKTNGIRSVINRYNTFAKDKKIGTIHGPSKDGEFHDGCTLVNVHHRICEKPGTRRFNRGKGPKDFRVEPNFAALVFKESSTINRALPAPMVTGGGKKRSKGYSTNSKTKKQKVQGNGSTSFSMPSPSPEIQATTTIQQQLSVLVALASQSQTEETSHDLASAMGTVASHNETDNRYEPQLDLPSSHLAADLFSGTHLFDLDELSTELTAAKCTETEHDIEDLSCLADFPMPPTAPSLEQLDIDLETLFPYPPSFDTFSLDNLLTNRDRLTHGDASQDVDFAPRLTHAPLDNACADPMFSMTKDLDNHNEKYTNDTSEGQSEFNAFDTFPCSLETLERLFGDVPPV